MVRQVNNIPNIISLNPNPAPAINPVPQANNLLNDLDGYIKLIERLMDLVGKFQNFKGISATPVNNNLYVPDMPNIPPQPTDINTMPMPTKDINENKGVETMQINLDFIITVLEQIDSFKQGITVREVIDFIKNDRATVEKLIEMNIPKGV